jgi:Zn-dependent peptidase ImmA (M78 family)
MEGGAMNRKRIKSLVDSILAQDGLRAIPIDLDKIARLANASVEIADLKAGLSGFAYQKNGMKFIGVSTADGTERQRFTFAHELGHLFLHKDDSMRYDQGLMMLRNEHSSDGTDIKEIEANRFAAELLMPEEELRKDMAESTSIDFMTDSELTKTYVKKLAEKYQVSPRAMNVRIATLYFN